MDDAGLAALSERIEGLRLRSPEAFRAGARRAGLVALAPFAALTALAGAALAVASALLPAWAALSIGSVVAFAAGAALASARRGNGAPPVGWPLRQGGAPDLEALVHAVGSRVGSPPPAAILLTGDANASVVRQGRRSVLLLGWPLLCATTHEELRAILAHELSHLAAPRGMRGVALAAWRDLVARRVPRSPALSAWRLARSRDLERAADRAAARETSPRVTGDALARVPLVSARLASHWVSVRARARARGAEHVAPFSEMTALLDGAGDERALAAALAQATRPWDAHPSLTERLRALGVEPRAPAAPRHPAAGLLGAAGSEAAQALDEAWRAAWLEAHAEDSSRRRAESLAHVRRERLRSARSRRSELERIALGRELEPSEAWEHAAAVGELDGPDAERALLERAVQRDPAHAASCFELGRLRLMAGDDSGADLLRRAADAAPSLRRSCAEILAGHAARSGRPEDATAADAALREAEALDDAARRERDTLPLRSDRYEGHGLGDELRALARACASMPDVREALLLRRRTSVMPERRAWLLAVERDPGHDASVAARRDAEVARRLLPLVEHLGDVACVVASLEGRAFVAKLSGPDTVAYRRGAHGAR